MTKSRPKTVAAAKKFRALIWLRDQGRDRATGQRLERHTDDWNRLGEVCHLKPKGRYPELKYETSNAFLMSHLLHIASDGRGGYRLKISGDADEVLTFVMHHTDGSVLWTRSSPNPTRATP